MRRKEFEQTDLQELEQFLQETSYGVLGTFGEDGWPELTPVNFVYVNDSVYFHGSRAGRKMSNLKISSRVSFSVSKEYAIIPSYLSDPKLACPATAFFKSALLRGTAVIVDDLNEKAEALGAFMRKLQPEGGYAPIDAEDPDYVPQLRATSVVRIDVESISGKFKFGQNMTESRLAGIADGLEERGRELDEETLALMEKYCPHHRR